MRFVPLLFLIAFNAFAVTPWQLLTQGAADDNSSQRAHAIVALGTIRTPQAERLVLAALNDKSSTVRLAAVSVLGEEKTRAAIPKLRVALDDEAAEVSFVAAKALWDMGDRSGRELLADVLAGERKTTPGFVKKQVQGAKSTLRSPKKLAWIGAKQGAGFLFGPLGFGIGMAEGMTHDTSAPARALSATMLGQSRDSFAQLELEEALDDKSPMVRVAAAKALGGFSNRALIRKLAPLLEDKNEAVWYMAAASIVRIQSGRVR